MRYIIDHDLHIHTGLSYCSGDKEQNPQRILEYAKKDDLKTICVTDHYWEKSVPCFSGEGFYRGQDFDRISGVCPLPKEEGIRFLFGCETDLDKNLNIGITEDRFWQFDFIIVPTTHLHMHTPDQNNTDPEYRAKLWIERFDAVLNMNLPFKKTGIAHLACHLINNSSRENYLKSLDKIPSEEMRRLFTKASDLGAGIEINQSDMDFNDNEADTVLRMFKIAKESGCKFYLGSDAHHPDWFDKTKETFERAIDLLDLKETDKFNI